MAQMGSWWVWGAGSVGLTRAVLSIGLTLLIDA